MLSSTACRTVSCSAARAGSATRAAEDSRRRAKFRRAGRYKISAACIGAPDAHLSVIQGAREGGTLLERNLDCGSVTGALLVLEPGDVSAHLVRYGGGVPGPATGAVAGIRISFDGPGR